MYGFTKRNMYKKIKIQNYGELPPFVLDVPIARNSDTLELHVPFYNFGHQVQEIKFYPLDLSGKQEEEVWSV